MIKRLIEFFQPPAPEKKACELDAAARKFTENYMKKYKEANFGRKIEGGAA